MLDVANPYFSQHFQHMRGNSVIHNVADTQVKGMRGIAQTATGNR